MLGQRASSFNHSMGCNRLRWDGLKFGSRDQKLKGRKLAPGVSHLVSGGFICGFLRFHLVSSGLTCFLYSYPWSFWAKFPPADQTRFSARSTCFLRCFLAGESVSWAPLGIFGKIAPSQAHSHTPCATRNRALEQFLCGSFCLRTRCSSRSRVVGSLGVIFFSAIEVGIELHTHRAGVCLWG